MILTVAYARSSTGGLALFLRRSIILSVLVCSLHVLALLVALALLWSLDLAGLSSQSKIAILHRWAFDHGLWNHFEGLARIVALGAGAATILLLRIHGLVPRTGLAIMLVSGVGLAAWRVLMPSMLQSGFFVVPGHTWGLALEGNNAPTRFAPGFSAAAFLSLRPGMTTAEVVASLGEPLSRRRLEAAMGTIWQYSESATPHDPLGRTDWSFWEAQVRFGKDARLADTRFHFRHDSTD